MAVAFVYGTLTEPDRVADLLESYVFVGPAVLSGLHAVDGDYPTLAPGGSVAGRLLRTQELDRLDEYERVDDGLYTRVAIPGEGDLPEVAVYVGDPDRLDADADWPGDGSFDQRVRAYVRSEQVSVRRQ